MRACLTIGFCAASLALVGAAAADDNALTPAEEDAGWRLLFDGRTLEGWQTSSQQPSQREVADGALNPHGCGGYMLIHEQTWENFELALDYQLSPGCNSGVFFRVWPLEPREGKDVGFNGLEIALDDTTGAGYHDSGALYDLVPPKRNAQQPAGEWNHFVLRCEGSRVSVELNGEVVLETDLADFTQPNVRPDGTPHKFDVAYCDHPRRGYIGLQDHGGDCWFKNIKLRELPPAE